MPALLPAFLPSRAAALFGLIVVLVAVLIGYASRWSVTQTPPDAPATVTPAPPDDVPPTPVPAPIPVPVAPAPAADTAPTEVPAAAPAAVTPALDNPPLPSAKPDEKTAEKPAAVPVPAKVLFAAKKLPSLGEAMAIGYYPRGCLQGGVELPINGPHWQVMRLSRNRNWGHPSLLRFVKNFADRAAKETGWNGILVGDLAQPRGGPAFSDHMSHQTGLDVDIWFVPMPKETLTPEQRESMSAYSLVADDWKHVNPAVYTPQHAAFIKAATEAPEVERVLVNAAIKKKLCDTVTGDRSWLEKVRPWYGHHDHIHVRLRCPVGQPGCRPQPPTPTSIGCADSDFKFWFTKALEPKKPSTKPPHPLTMADLPPACKAVLAAPAKDIP